MSWFLTFSLFLDSLSFDEQDGKEERTDPEDVLATELGPELLLMIDLSGALFPLGVSAGIYFQ